MKRYVHSHCSSFERGGGNTPVISPLSGTPEITYDAGYVRAHVPPLPLLQRAGGSAPVMHPRAGVPGFVVAKLVL